ncbi:undecaprenyl-diphosphate phosphatase, partial [Cutibacterium acnes]
VSYFWRDVRALATNSIVAMARGQLQDPWFRLALWIVLATIPIAVAGLSASKLLNTCNSPLRGVVVIGWACVAMAVLLGAAEIYARHRRTIGEA